MNKWANATSTKFFFSKRAPCIQYKPEQQPVLFGQISSPHMLALQLLVPFSLFLQHNIRAAHFPSSTPFTTDFTDSAHLFVDLVLIILWRSGVLLGSYVLGRDVFDGFMVYSLIRVFIWFTAYCLFCYRFVDCGYRVIYSWFLYGWVAMTSGGRRTWCVHVANCMFSIPFLGPSLRGCLWQCLYISSS